MILIVFVQIYFTSTLRKNVIADFVVRIDGELVLILARILCQLYFLFWLNLHVAKVVATTLMTPIAEALKEEHQDMKDY
jgi:hypothetical protein